MLHFGKYILQQVEWGRVFNILDSTTLTGLGCVHTTIFLDGFGYNFHYRNTAVENKLHKWFLQLTLWFKHSPSCRSVSLVFFVDSTDHTGLPFSLISTSEKYKNNTGYFTPELKDNGTNTDMKVWI